jgi:hypothetical protein
MASSKEPEGAGEAPKRDLEKNCQIEEAEFRKRSSDRPGKRAIDGSHL